MPFAFQLDLNGNPAQPYADHKKLNSEARVVVMAEGMAKPLPRQLGRRPALGSFVNPTNTKW